MKEQQKSNFSQNLVKLRKKAGLSQIELAEKCDLSQRIISYYETKASKPPIDNVAIIACALGASINDLLGIPETDNQIIEDLSKMDTRTLKKIKQLLKLNPQERSVIYKMVESMSKSEQ